MRTLFIATFALVAILLTAAHSQTVQDEVTETILSSWSQRNYTTAPVTDAEIDRIIQCGIKAPSARNSQLWKFTVVKDQALCAQVMPNITAGNVLIIVSGAESSQGINVDFDCGLATENMFIAAQGMGLGARIYMNPISTVVSLRDSLGIPEGYRPIVVLRVGNIEATADAASAASPRKAASEIVNVK